jgi:toxin HigB-1
MIEGFKPYRGLRRLYEADDPSGVNAEHLERLALLLSALDAAVVVTDLAQPTFDLHQLKGKRRGVWTIKVRANWRITFRFVDGRVSEVDLEDYD